MLKIESIIKKILKKESIWEKAWSRKQEKLDHKCMIVLKKQKMRG